MNFLKIVAREEPGGNCDCNNNVMAQFTTWNKAIAHGTSLEWIKLYYTVNRKLVEYYIYLFICLFVYLFIANFYLFLIGTYQPRTRSVRKSISRCFSTDRKTKERGSCEKWTEGKYFLAWTEQIGLTKYSLYGCWLVFFHVLTRFSSLNVAVYLSSWLAGWTSCFHQLNIHLSYFYTISVKQVQ